MENQADATLRGAAAGGMTLDELFGAVEQEWQDQALCAQTDPEAFFPEKGGSTREAKRICVIGEGATIGARCELQAGMRVWPGVEIPDSGVRFSPDA